VNFFYLVNCQKPMKKNTDQTQFLNILGVIIGVVSIPAGFCSILCTFLPVIGLTLNAIAFFRIRQTEKRSDGLAIVGIIINIFAIIIPICLLVFGFSLGIGSILSGNGYYRY